MYLEFIRDINRYVFVLIKKSSLSQPQLINMWYFYQINETILCIFIDLRDKLCVKVEKILKGSLDLIPSPSPLVKIQIIGRKFYLVMSTNFFFSKAC